MNSEQSASILLALEAAVRAGFAVTVEPATTGGTSVTVHPKVIRSGATERVERFTICREELRDALGNAMAVVVLEVGADRKRNGEMGRGGEAVAT